MSSTLPLQIVTIFLDGYNYVIFGATLFVNSGAVYLLYKNPGNLTTFRWRILMMVVGFGGVHSLLCAAMGVNVDLTTGGVVWNGPLGHLPIPTSVWVALHSTFLPIILALILVSSTRLAVEADDRSPVQFMGDPLPLSIFAAAIIVCGAAACTAMFTAGFSPTAEVRQQTVWWTMGDVFAIMSTCMLIFGILIWPFVTFSLIRVVKRATKTFRESKTSHVRGLSISQSTLLHQMLVFYQITYACVMFPACAVYLVIFCATSPNQAPALATALYLAVLGLHGVAVGIVYPLALPKIRAKLRFCRKGRKQNSVLPKVSTLPSHINTATAYS